VLFYKEMSAIEQHNKFLTKRSFVQTIWNLNKVNDNCIQSKEEENKVNYCCKFHILQQFIALHFSAKSGPIHDTDGFIRSFLKQLKSGTMNWTELYYPNRYLTLHLSAIIAISILFEEFMKSYDSECYTECYFDKKLEESDEYKKRALVNATVASEYKKHALDAMKVFLEVPSNQFDKDEKRTFNEDFWTSVIEAVF
jgi:hypothetical protein